MLCDQSAIDEQLLLSALIPVEEEREAIHSCEAVQLAFKRARDGSQQMTSVDFTAMNDSRDPTDTLFATVSIEIWAQFSDQEQEQNLLVDMATILTECEHAPEPREAAISVVNEGDLIHIGI